MNSDRGEPTDGSAKTNALALIPRSVAIDKKAELGTSKCRVEACEYNLVIWNRLAPLKWLFVLLLEVCLDGSDSYKSDSTISSTYFGRNNRAC